VEKVCPEAKFKEQFELYARNFLENEVLGDQLQFLTREDLEQDLKIKSLMHRKWILQAIQQLIGYQQTESSDESSAHRRELSEMQEPGGRARPSAIRRQFLPLRLFHLRSLST